MIEALDILRRERDDASDQIRMLRGRIRDLEAAIAVLEGQPAPARSGRSSTNIKQSVLTILDNAGDNGATPKELTEALVKIGHQTSEASVSSTLSRLKGEDKVSNRGGRWFAASEHAPKPTAQVPQPQVAPWDELEDDVPF